MAAYTVARVDGVVLLLDPREPVTQGMALPENAVLMAAGGGRVILADGTVLSLSAGQSATLIRTEDVPELVVAQQPTDVDPDIAALQAAIAAGQDPTELQQAPAAGAAQDAGGGSLSGEGGFSQSFDVDRSGREQQTEYRYSASFSDTGTTPSTFSGFADNTEADNTATTPTDPNTGGGTTTPTDPNTGGGTTTPTDPNTGGGTTTPIDPNAGGGTTTPTDPNTGGGTTTPTDPNTGGGTTTPVVIITLNTVAEDDIINADEARSSIIIGGSAGGDTAAGDTVTITIGDHAYMTVVDASLAFSVTVPGQILISSDMVIATISHVHANGVSTATASHVYTIRLDAPIVSISLDAITDDDVLNAVIKYFVFK